MGRIFEVRKATMFARYDRMAKQFTRVGKEIVIAVKSGGPDPENNPALRRAIQNAKSVNMPKDKVESAIKRAMGRDASDLEEIRYEGYAPHGVAVIVETATDNSQRTVANVRAVFNKNDGSLGTSNSVAFQFDRMGVFKLKSEELDMEELELDLIDHGLEDMGEGTTENDEPCLVVRVNIQDFGTMQSALEAKGIEPISSELEWIPQNMISLPEDKAEEVLKLIGKMEEDEDVQRVFHNLE